MRYRHLTRGREAVANRDVGAALKRQRALAVEFKRKPAVDLQQVAETDLEIGHDGKSCATLGRQIDHERLGLADGDRQRAGREVHHGAVFGRTQHLQTDRLRRELQPVEAHQTQLLRTRLQPHPLTLAVAQQGERKVHAAEREAGGSLVDDVAQAVTVRIRPAAVRAVDARKGVEAAAAEGQRLHRDLFNRDLRDAARHDIDLAGRDFARRLLEAERALQVQVIPDGDLQFTAHAQQLAAPAVGRQRHHGLGTRHHAERPCQEIDHTVRGLVALRKAGDPIDIDHDVARGERHIVETDGSHLGRRRVQRHPPRAAERSVVCIEAWHISFGRQQRQGEIDAAQREADRLLVDDIGQSVAVGIRTATIRAVDPRKGLQVGAAHGQCPDRELRAVCQHDITRGLLEAERAAYMEEVADRELEVPGDADHLAEVARQAQGPAKVQPARVGAHEHLDAAAGQIDNESARVGVRRLATDLVDRNEHVARLERERIDTDEGDFAGAGFQRHPAQRLQ